MIPNWLHGSDSLGDVSLDASLAPPIAANSSFEGPQNGRKEAEDDPSVVGSAAGDHSTWIRGRASAECARSGRLSLISFFSVFISRDITNLYFTFPLRLFGHCLRVYD